MFDKYKKRWAKLEEDHEAIRKVRLHVEKHQVVYASGVTGLVCIFGTRAFARPTQIINIVEQATPVIAPVINNSPVFNNDNSSLVNFGGHMTKMVKRLSDGKIWETVTEAAGDEGFDMTRFSRHLNGHTEHLNGEIYTIVGIGTTG